MVSNWKNTKDNINIICEITFVFIVKGKALKSKFILFSLEEHIFLFIISINSYYARGATFSLWIIYNSPEIIKNFHNLVSTLVSVISNELRPISTSFIGY